MRRVHKCRGFGRDLACSLDNKAIGGRNRGYRHQDGELIIPCAVALQSIVDSDDVAADRLDLASLC
jgi:hypothetical protein